MSYQSLDNLFNKNKQKSRLQFWNGLFKKYNKPDDDPGIKQKDIVQFVSMQYDMNHSAKSKGKTTNIKSPKKANKENVNDSFRNLKKGQGRKGGMQCLNKNHKFAVETKSRRKILAPNENTIFIKQNSNIRSNSKTSRKSKRSLDNFELGNIKLENPYESILECSVKLMQIDLTKEDSCKVEIKSEDIPTSKKRIANLKVEEYEESFKNGMRQVKKSQSDNKRIRKSKSCVRCEEIDNQVHQNNSLWDCKIKSEATKTNLSNSVLTEVKAEIVTDIKHEDELVSVTEKRRSPRLLNKVKLEANNGNSEVDRISDKQRKCQPYSSKAQCNIKTKDIKPVLIHKCNTSNKFKLPSPPKQSKLKENVVYLVHPLVKQELMIRYPEMCENKSFGANKTYSKQHLDQTVFDKDIPNADVLKTKILIEKNMQSDLEQRVFERYCAQQQNINELFKFWNNAVKQELLRLKKVVSLDQLRSYMITALAEKIALCNKNRETEEKRYCKKRRGVTWHNTM